MTRQIRRILAQKFRFWITENLKQKEILFFWRKQNKKVKKNNVFLCS